MIHRLAGLLLAFSTLGAAAQEPKEIVPDALTATILERILYDKRETCILVGVVAETTRVIFACSREGAEVVLERDSIFELGSLSKVFAGVLLADMVRRGEVSLDDPASKYSPPGAKIPSRDGRAITLRHLVTHTASLPAMPPDISPTEFLKLAMVSPVLYDALAKVELERPIGGDVVYSNLGFVWLADLLARRAGKRYDQLLAERVLEPLGMRDTGVLLTPQQARRRAVGHDRSYKAVAPLEFPPALAAASGLNASMDDLVKFAEALTGRRKSPLDESIAMSMTPLHVLNAGASMGYAWFLSQRPDGRIVFHDGQTPGVYSAIAVNPRTRTAAIVLADTATDFGDLAVHLVDPRAPLKTLPKAP